MKRVTKEGLWLARTPTEVIENREDFGITFHQVSSVMTNSLALDNAAGLYTFMYDSPTRVQISLPFEEGKGEERRGWGRRPSREYVLEKVKEFAGDPDSEEHATALNVLEVASRRPDGSYYITVVPRPNVGWRCLFSAGTDPEIMLPGAGKTRLERWREEQLSRMLSLYDGRYDGQYIDSAEWLSETVNCRREHFAYADYPLGFDWATGTPGINTGVTRYEYLKAVREELLEVGKLMMANLTPIRYAFYTNLLDVGGMEGWDRRGRGDGFGDESEEGRRWVSPFDWRSEEAAYHRRAMMYQKPYCYLLKLMTKEELAEFGMERVREYLDWCTFFAIYPGLGHGLDEDPDPYREIYRRYMPVIRALGMGGWEPLTHAATDNAAVRVERYGHWSQGTLRFAVRNFSDEEASGELRIDAEALRIGEGAAVRDAFTGEGIEFERGGGKITVPMTVGRARTGVIHVGFGWDGPAAEDEEAKEE